MHYVTDFVFANEPCFGLWEGSEMAPVPDQPGAMDWRRVQKVFVLRGDTIAKYIEDLGPASAFENVAPIIIRADGDKDSVQMIRESAEHSRNDDYWRRRQDELIASSTLINDIIEDADQMAEWFRSKTVIGPSHRQQREGPSLTAIRRRQTDKGHEKAGKVIYGFGTNSR